MAAIQGDWYIGHSDSESYPVKDQLRCVFSDQANGDRFMVAKAWSDGEGDYESTARLIAAAPQLLERLKAMVSGRGCECDTADQEHPLCEVCWSRQVIAKAEGGDA